MSDTDLFRLTVVLSLIVGHCLVTSPVDAARVVTSTAVGGHQQRTSANRHDHQSAAHHPASVTVNDLERYVDDRLSGLEARFNQRLADQARKLNQSIAIKYIERVLDYISEELQNSQDLIAAAGLNAADQNDSTGSSTEALSHEVDRQRGELARVKETMAELQSAMDRLNDRLAAPPSTTTSGLTVLTPDEYIAPSTTSSVTVYPIDCQEAYDLGILLRANGFQYTLIRPRLAKEPFKACCYVNNTAGWTVIQRRLDGTIDFYRNWDDYKRGFGQSEAEFWLGNERIHKLTSQGDYRLRVEMVTWDDNQHWAEYQYFRVAPESERYRLHVSGYVPESDAGDSLTSAWDNDHNGQPFSTYDSDNDARFYDNCAQHYRGAWWFRSCFQSHLNGVYYHRGSHSNFFVRNGIQWNTIHPHSSLRYVAMMVRRTTSHDPIASSTAAGVIDNGVE